MSFLQPRPPSTHDLYGPMHKGLRYALCQMLTRLGAADPLDDAAVDRLMIELRAQLDLSEHHRENEDRHVHTALEARAPGASVRMAHAHDVHRLIVDELDVLIVRTEQAEARERPKLLKEIYLTFSSYVAEDFAHMAEEEQVMLPVLQSLFTDTELQAIEDRILADTAPHDMVSGARMMVPAYNRKERFELLSTVRATAPAEAFDAILERAVRPLLSKEDWDHLVKILTITV